MFQPHHLDTHLYPISPNDVHLYEDQIQININVSSYLDDKGRARHFLVISRKNYEHVAYLLYWKGHYAQITNITRLFSDITKHNHEHQICFCCLRHFRTKESFARHKQLFTREDFISVLHVLPTPGSNQSHFKFINYKFCIIAPFVIYADFESILEPLGRHANQTTYTQQRKVCAASAILCWTLGRYNQLTVKNVGKNALSEMLNVLMECETTILEKLQTDRPMKRMSAQKLKKYVNAM